MFNKLRNRYDTVPIEVKATGWFMLCNIIQRGISVITTPIFTRILTIDQYGEFTLYQSWLSIFTLLSTFRITYSVFNKGMSKFKFERNEFTLSMQTTMSIITTIVLLVYLTFQDGINSFTEMSTFITLAMFMEIYFSSAIQLWSLKHRYEFHYRIIILPTLLLAFLNPILGIFVVTVSDSKGMARIISSVAVQVLFGIVFYIINIKNSKGLFNFNHAKFAIIFNMPLIPHYLSTYMLDQADRIMIQKICGYGDAAIYSVAYNAGTLMKIVTDAINNSIIPWIYQQLEEENYQKIEKYVFLVQVFIALTCILFVLIAPECMMILGGKDYIQAMYVIPPVAGSIFFIFFFSIVSNIEFYYDANKFTMYISIAGAMLNTILNSIFIRRFGYLAAGYTTLVSYVFFAIVHYAFMTILIKKKIGIILIHPKKIILLSITLILIIISMNYFYNYNILRYMLVTSLLLLLFFKRNDLKQMLMITKK